MTTVPIPSTWLPEVAHQHAGKRLVISRLAGPVAFSLIFFALDLLTVHSGFISDQHSHIVADVLVAKQQESFNARILELPPLIALTAFIQPSLIFLGIIASFAAGSSMWVVWRQLHDTPALGGVRVLLIVAYGLAPAILFQSTMQISEMLAALFILLSWRYYIRFVYFGVTWNGFAAGLILALAFFSNFSSVFFVIPFALAAPATLLQGEHLQRAERWRADIAGVLVIGFPACFALFAWAYVNWTFSGDPLSFLLGHEGAFRYGDASASALMGFHNALGAIPGDMLRAPIYPLVALLVLPRGLRSSVAYCFPLVLITAVRTARIPFSEAFAVVVYLGFAYVSVVAAVGRPVSDRPVVDRPVVDRFGLPSLSAINLSAIKVRPSSRNGSDGRNSRDGRLILALVTFAALAQLTANIVVPLRGAEAQSWSDAVLIGNKSTDDLQLSKAAKELARQPKSSILADDSVAYNIIASGGTVSPYVLPSSAKFELARSDPARFVDHILVATTPSATDRLYQRFSGGALDFSIDVEWEGWQVLTRNGALSVSVGR